jgi:hypothetical protein
VYPNVDHDWEDIDEIYDEGVVFIHFVCRRCQQHANINQNTFEDTLTEATQGVSVLECSGL